MNKNKRIEMYVSDAITERPMELVVERRKFKIYPPTLGKMQVLSKYYLMLDIDEEQFANEPIKEAMRLCEEKTDIVCQLMAVATMRDKEDLLNNDKIADVAEYFKWAAKATDFSECILAILVQVDYENFITSIRLTKTLRQNKPKQGK